MPVPQENLLFLEQASCLLLTMVQNVNAQGSMPKAQFPIPEGRSYHLFRVLGDRPQA
ncbi:MAG: hypothetical protein JGK17_29220 [Microcoleus sp. PH2017_10_PVI_O_A]|uniref:hypothetical protein n=1 Tax=unclassified Microcoleus TaxID=2642155 RepID=UPI001DF48800|nr:MULTISPECIES: hypothetical protein [unclassified Microcoleus]MCC3409562.1 hypothetical protein [Microcoleus sp. PH2017_10_PVI_O_A]MCC3463801.1 hypothetical protein [Microcoleus sp. PH2017_11_PCY_U_A]MCC3482143.1 hypothetical protein [Microcoleus sp. PH2017_12_PCY_D_A]MCC3528166.1 hypothetical protein [Microcoleus sp. PH2017_21_RUC_O_A]MCC3540193.1 hypothetical protein [Microcoleus sp. PH2017_22_RUC_O_B]